MVPGLITLSNFRLDIPYCLLLAFVPTNKCFNMGANANFSNCLHR